MQGRGFRYGAKPLKHKVFREVSDRATTQPHNLHTLTAELVQFTAPQHHVLATLWSELFSHGSEFTDEAPCPQTNPVRGEAGVHLHFIWLQPHALVLRSHCLDIKEQTKSSVSRALWGFERTVIPCLCCHLLR